MRKTPARAELTLAEMLADPIVRIVMRRDGVTEQEIRALLSLGGQSDGPRATRAIG